MFKDVRGKAPTKSRGLDFTIIKVPNDWTLVLNVFQTCFKHHFYSCFKQGDFQCNPSQWWRGQERG
jgi:hypothetical protein